jgi:carbon-monoxide dehydrogenase small subunit
VPERVRPRSGRLQGLSRDRNLRAQIPDLRHEVELVVNGERCSLDVEPRTLLVHALRDELGLTGAHVGCDTSQCGACTVLLDGRAVKSCTVLALQAEDADVTTIEGLTPADGELHPIQRAFVEHHGLQCGFCTPGVILTTADLLSRDPGPDDETVRRALRGNLCRCTGYQTIVESIHAAAAALQAEAAT